MLIAKLSRPPITKSASTARTLAPIVKTIAKPPPVRDRTGLYEPAFRQTALVNAELRKAAAMSTAGSPPAPVTVPKPKMRAPGELIDPDFNADDPSHVHARMARETAGAHADLIERVKRALNPHLRQSTGPEAL